MSEKNKRIDLNDRETIAIDIVRKQPLKKIAGLLGCHVTSISNEIRKHRIFVSGNYYVGNDCRYVKGCDKRNICGDEDCPMFCYACHKDCQGTMWLRHIRTGFKRRKSLLRKAKD